MLTSLRRFGLLIAVLLITAGFTVLFSTSQHDTQQRTQPAKLAIDELTQAERVIDFLKKHRRLPDYYISKQEARRLGWNMSVGDLCTVAPNKAIGGDRFANRENHLPNSPQRTWFEADIDYKCGFRGAKRLVYSNDGLIYLTTDHYRSFKPVH